MFLYIVLGCNKRVRRGHHKARIKPPYFSDASAPLRHHTKIQSVVCKDDSKVGFRFGVYRLTILYNFEVWLEVSCEF